MIIEKRQQNMVTKILVRLILRGPSTYNRGHTDLRYLLLTLGKYHKSIRLYLRTLNMGKISSWWVFIKSIIRQKRTNDDLKNSPLGRTTISFRSEPMDINFYWTTLAVPCTYSEAQFFKKIIQLNVSKFLRKTNYF